jgi:hypothetical protein
MEGSLGRLDPELLAQELAPFVQEGNLSLALVEVPVEAQDNRDVI